MGWTLWGWGGSEGAWPELGGGMSDITTAKGCGQNSGGDITTTKGWS